MQNILQNDVNGNNYHKLLQPCHVKVQNILQIGLNGNNYHKHMHVLLTTSCNCTSMVTWFTNSFLNHHQLPNFHSWVNPQQSISSIPSVESTHKIVRNPIENFTYISQEREHIRCHVHARYVVTFLVQMPIFEWSKGLYLRKDTEKTSRDWTMCSIHRHRFRSNR